MKISQRKLSVAIQLCKLALAPNPRSLYAYSSLMILCVKNKNDERVLEASNSATVLNFKYSKSYFRLGYELSRIRRAA